MSHGSTEHNLEHAEHAQHQAHNPFDRKVAMTMAIMAALLAGVTLVSHRGHTETLRLATEATTYHTKATDDWNLYQATNIRSHEFQSYLILEALLAKDSVKTDAESVAMRNFFISKLDKYQGKGFGEHFLENLKTPKAKSEAKADTHEAKPAGEHKASGDHKSKEESAKVGELDRLKIIAEEKQDHATKLEGQSHELHGNVTWIDMGHLGLELALVFCAVAVLTKQRSFWLTGIGFGLVGSGLAIYGMAGWWMMAEITGGHH